MDGQTRKVTDKSPPNDTGKTWAYYVLETAKVEKWDGKISGTYVFWATWEK